MNKGRSSLKLMGFFIAVVIVFSFGIVSQSIGFFLDSDDKRADVIAIDTLKIFGEIERPEVVFLHDQHTDALEKLEKDCSECHLSAKDFNVVPESLKTAVKNIDRLSPKFKRLKNTGRNDVMDIYHRFCIDCHTDLLDSGQKSGPVTCGTCHVEKVEIKSKGQPLTFDKSLHFRHTETLENKCEQCHHDYDKKKKTLFYEKGNEGSCAYCHKEEARGNKASHRDAFHIACIQCHKETIEANKDAGPVKCSGCHDPKNQAAFEKIKDVPRYNGKQPDTVMIKTGKTDGKKEMQPVPFDHKAHEAYNDTCKVCHHSDLESCSKCHTLKGTKEGKFITLEQAMHRADSKSSCIGCHKEELKNKNCYGCHGVMVKTDDTNKESCKNCHTDLPSKVKKNKCDSSLAKSLLGKRKPVVATIKSYDIPGDIVIKDLVDKYEGSKFPHKKIVNALLDGINENKMAVYFHSSKTTICEGCHHNSPGEVNPPPRCNSCHGEDEDDESMPGIVGAYHKQCIGCHENMGLTALGGCCTCCHEEKK